MRLRNLKNTKEILENCEFIINNPEKFKGHFIDNFNNNNAIHLEIGMGKGRFIYEMALKYPDINFIGLEKFDSVIARAILKIEATKEIPKNLKVIREDANNLANIFDHEIDTLYLNFSDPWPKKRYHKRRLTHENFLKIYDHIFRGTKKIILKTDNNDLFNFSLESLKAYGYKIDYLTTDLHNENIDNVETEYEIKFKNLGIKINSLIATKK